MRSSNPPTGVLRIDQKVEDARKACITWFGMLYAGSVTWFSLSRQQVTLPVSSAPNALEDIQ
ncbi:MULTISPECIES: hypothetical protein [Photorhabdus]|uniref:hypothetical protein n=1 Tax=Photorhabdus TaxID=29487 RepID=UPI0011C37209|nr:hypothetical protein [Photorhabdus asymbiotica]